MYTNKCIKCGCEFETKNPKRVICPNCLYPEKRIVTSEDGSFISPSSNTENIQKSSYSSYSTGNEHINSYSSQQRMSGDGNYNRSNINYSNQKYNKPYNSQYRREVGNSGSYRNNSYNITQKSYGGHNPRRSQQKTYNQRGSIKSRYQQGGKVQHRDVSKRLLITKEQMLEIENLYKAMLPLPNHDAHEVIAEKLSLEPRKVFFGINLIRQKLMLPKLNFPKRKLAVTEDQVFAIKNLYEPLLPLPPIGCHKIIAAQLKMDEWRVHVGIGVVRRQMGLERWNLERTDIPESLREKEVQSKIKKAEKKALEKAKKAELKRKHELEKAAKENEQKQAILNNVDSSIDEIKIIPQNDNLKDVDNNNQNEISEVKNTTTSVKKRVVKKTETVSEE